ncbi:efflux RND transporter periplasmic adaptor subunit, partial [bacterium]|nr:efflux RND transporter periplasmic adaptor subunit [bacterium]
MRYIQIILIITLVLLGIIIAGCGNKSSAPDGEKQLYTCGMHPEVISDKPGLCPICNMKLTPISRSGGSARVPDGERKILYWVAPMDPTYIRDEPGKSPMGMDLVPVYEDEVMSGSGVTIDPVVIQNMGVKYSQVKRGPLKKTIRAAAHVDYNEDQLAVLSTRTDGWIEKLYITSPGVAVKAGDPLFEFYSPKLFSAQEEYRIALKTGDSTLTSAAHERLKLLGISDAEIDRIRRGETKRTLTITSPIDGVVVRIGSTGVSAGGSGGGGSGGMSGGGSGGMSGMGGLGGATGGTGGMSGGSSGGMNTGSGATIREGEYVGSGSSVFTIANLDSLWVYAHAYDDELPFLKVGMKAVLQLDYLPGESFEGTIDFIYPFLDQKTRDIKIRITFPNSDRKLYPQMYGTVSMENSISDNALLVPKESVIYSGDHKYVFVALSAGKFIPQEIIAGPSDSTGNIQVLSGLLEGQTVVTSGQFLLDSESRLKEALNKMLAAKSGGVDKQESDQAAMPDNKWPNLAPDDPNAKFACPMPQDRYYAAEDGDCPICGMHLV